MKKSYVGSVFIVFMFLLTCAAQATCIEVNAVNTPGGATAQFVIGQPGSYCLGSNVVGVSGAGGNLIVRNDATFNTTNYDVVTGNTNTNANVETPGANFVLTRPWANFVH